MPLDLKKPIGEYISNMKEMDAPTIQFKMTRDGKPVAAFVLIQGEATPEVLDAIDEAVEPYLDDHTTLEISTQP